MSTTYFTSDLHFGHRLVAGIRGFWTTDFNSSTGTDEREPDVTSHAVAVMEAWHQSVKPDDIVWVLGDLCVSGKWWSEALRLVGGLPGRKRLICGNHDPVSSIHREAWKHQRAAMEVFESVQDYGTVRIAGKTVLLSHYPYSGTGSEGLDDETGKPRSEERYTEWRLQDRGRPLIHGHTHGKEKLHFSDAGTPQIHVGLDAWNMQLVPVHAIEELLVDSSVSHVRLEA